MGKEPAEEVQCYRRIQRRPAGKAYIHEKVSERVGREVGKRPLLLVGLGFVLASLQGGLEVLDAFAEPLSQLRDLIRSKYYDYDHENDQELLHSDACHGTPPLCVHPPEYWTERSKSNQHAVVPLATGDSLAVQEFEKGDRMLAG